MAANVFREAKFFMSVDSPQKLGDSRAEIAFVGRSNVGKSSLLNALCGRTGLAEDLEKARQDPRNKHFLGRARQMDS